jgi:hypothetical protein
MKHLTSSELTRYFVILRLKALLIGCSSFSSFTSPTAWPRSARAKHKPRSKCRKCLTRYLSTRLPFPVTRRSCSTRTTHRPDHDRTLVRSEIHLDCCILLTYWLYTTIEYLRSYLTQVRQELAVRLIERLYADGTGVPSKWWMSFQKRRFMNRSLG